MSVMVGAAHAGCAGIGLSEKPECVDANQGSRNKWNFHARQLPNSVGHCGQGFGATALKCLGDHVVGFAAVEHAVHNEALIAKADGVQLMMCPLGLSQSSAFGPAHQIDGGSCSIGECAYRVVVQLVLGLQSRQRSETRSAADVVLDKSGPRGGKLKQPKGVPGRRGIKNDMVKIDRGLSVTQQFCKLFKGCNFKGARAGQLLLDAL